MSNIRNWYKRIHQYIAYTLARGEHLEEELDAIQSSFEKIPELNDDGTEFTETFGIKKPTQDNHPVQYGQIKHIEQQLANIDSNAQITSEQAQTAIQYGQAAKDIAVNLIKPDGYKYIGRCKSIAELRTIKPKQHGQRILVDAYYEGGTTGGGEFVADLNDQSSEDDAGSVIVGEGGTRWKRIIIQSGKDFGLGLDETVPMKQIVSALSQEWIKLDSNVSCTEAIKMDGQIKAGYGEISGSHGGTILSIKNGIGSELSHMLIERNSSNDVNGHALTLVGGKQYKLHNLVLNGVEGKGSGIIALPEQQDSFIRDVDIRDVSVSGNFNKSIDTNGSLITNGYRCFQQNLRVHGIKSFGVEFKNKTYFSMINNVLVESTKIGVGFGQDTEEADDVSHCLINNVIAKGCNYGAVLGDAKYNIVSNLLYDSDNSYPEIRLLNCAVRFNQSSQYNIASTVLAMGDSLKEAIRFDRESKNNYCSVASFGNGSFVSYESGASRNVTEILHPSKGNSIQYKIDRTQLTGNLSGENANPVFCHATGEYVGILSPRFRRVIEFSDNEKKLRTPHKDAIINNGDTLNAIVGEGVVGTSYINSSGEAGISFSADGTYFKLYTPDAGVRFYKSTIRPEIDNQVSLGIGGYRFKDIFLGNSTINTSDQRFKQDINEIPDNILEAWADVNFYQYRWIDSVKIKQNKARIHMGVLAQQIVETFKKHGLNALDYGLVCIEKWDAQDEIIDDDGVIIQEKRDKGECYGVRLEECLILEAELNRRERKMILSKMQQIEKSLQMNM